jgi:hypothetical protein
MLNLSGAIDALLFLIIRPHLLLFTPPEDLGETNVELAKLNTGSAIYPDMVNTSKVRNQQGRESWITYDEV